MPSRVTVEEIEMFGLKMWAVCVYGSTHHVFDDAPHAEAAAEKLRLKFKEGGL